MNKTLNIGVVFSWLFAVLVFSVGILNLLLVHAVPGLAYILFSLVYLPPINEKLRSSFGFSISPAVKIILGIAIIMFTLGVSDLGDMID